MNIKNVAFAVVAVLVCAAAYGVVIDSTNNFGRGTTTAVNTMSADQNTPATVTLTTANAGKGLLASIFSAGSRSIKWQTGNYPASAGVNINLLRKVSDSPVSYELVRQLANNTANDGEESWTPAAGEQGDNLYIEVTCSNASAFPNGCQLQGQALKAF